MVSSLCCVNGMAVQTLQQTAAYLWRQQWRVQQLRHRNQSSRFIRRAPARLTPPTSRHLAGMPMEVMICWCYPLHLFVWTRRHCWPVPLTSISRQPPSSTGAPARSAPVISCALDCAVLPEANPGTNQNTHRFLFVQVSERLVHVDTSAHNSC